MRIQGIRVQIVILALLLALGAFFGAQHLIREYWIGQPLQEELGQIDGVLEVEILEGAVGPIIQVQLGPVENILTTYQAIQEIGEGLLKNQDFEILLQNPHQEMESIYFALHYHLYQYLSQGNYLALKNYLESAALDLGLDSALFFLDCHYLYLQLISGEKTYYQRIPRHGKEVPRP